MNVTRTLLFAAVSLLVIACFTGCADKGAQMRIITPIGTIDTTTSGTTELDLRGLMQEKMPAQKSYNYDSNLQQIEK